MPSLSADVLSESPVESSPVFLAVQLASATLQRSHVSACMQDN